MTSVLIILGYFFTDMERDILEWLDKSDSEALSEDEHEGPVASNHIEGNSSSDDEESGCSDTIPRQLENIYSSDEETASTSTPRLPPALISRARSRGRGRTLARGIGRGKSSQSVSSTRGRVIRQRGCGRAFGRSRGFYQRRYQQFNQEWTHNSFMPDIKNLQQPAYLMHDRSQWNPMDFLLEYIDDDLLEKVVIATNRTAVSKTGKSLTLTLKELKIFIGANFIMSCLRFPKIRMYWSRKWRVPIIADSITRDRFFKIRSSLKILYDDDLGPEEKKKDRIWKVRPLINRILDGCHKQERTIDMSIDEMMIPFSGQCGIRVYLPSKPNPLGLKVLVLANPNGVVCDMIVYQGETTFSSELTDRYSLGECSIIFLTRSLVPGHIIHCDRYFTTIKLIDTMLENGFYIVGTIMANRIPRNVPMISDKELMAKGRGTTFTTVREDGKLAITKWQDNKPVYLVSSRYAAEKTDSCQCWSKKIKFMKS